MTIALNVTSSLLGFISAALCILACWRLRDTTLSAPCAWAAAAFCGLAAVEAAVAQAPPSDSRAAGHAQYLAAVMVIAPFVALLGAKRPQNVAWQWIVLSLVGLLAFQALRSWSIEAAVPSPHATWRWLLATVVVMQLCNYLPTRYFTPACLAFAGQVCVLGRYLPLEGNPPKALFAVGLTMLSLSVALAALVRSGRAPADASQAAWSGFRDRFGSLWALRVCQRVNALADEQKSPFQLSWNGISPRHSAAEATDDRALRRALRSVLGRFLSARWFEDRHEVVS